MVVAERDRPTRTTLARQLSASGVEATVLEQASLVASAIENIEAPAAALVLVDPFRIRNPEWQLAEEIVAALDARRIALLMFDYRRSTAWPDACGRLLRVAQVRSGVFHLAAYGDAKAASEVWRNVGSGPVAPQKS